MTKPIEDPRGFLTELFKIAVAEADPMKVVPRHLPKDKPERLFVIGAGKAITSVTGRISMNGVPRATARAAKGKRSTGAKVDTVVQPKWMNVPPSPQITWAFGNVAACLRWTRSRNTVSRSSCRARADWPVRRSSLCRHHEAAVAQHA